MGVLFCKKVELCPAQGALCTVSVFFILHFTYLGGVHLDLDRHYKLDTTDRPKT